MDSSGLHTQRLDHLGIVAGICNQIGSSSAKQPKPLRGGPTAATPLLWCVNSASDGVICMLAPTLTWTPMSIDTYIQQILTGSIIIFAVMISSLSQQNS